MLNKDNITDINTPKQTVVDISKDLGASAFMVRSKELKEREEKEFHIKMLEIKKRKEDFLNKPMCMINTIEHLKNIQKQELYGLLAECEYKISRKETINSSMDIKSICDSYGKLTVLDNLKQKILQY